MRKKQYVYKTGVINMYVYDNSMYTMEEYKEGFYLFLLLFDVLHDVKTNCSTLSQCNVFLQNYIRINIEVKSKF